MSHSFVVPSSEVPGYSPIYRHPKYKDGTQGKEFAHVKTLYELLTTLVENNPKKEFLGTREYFPETNKFGKYTWVTTTETMEIVNDLGAGLDSLYAKHAPELNDATGQQALGVFSIGRAEWFLAEFAGFRSRRYTVGITDAAGVEVSEYVMNFADTRIVVSAMDKIPRMLDRIKNTPNVKVIISMDKLDCSKPSLATQAFSAEVTQKLVAQAESLGVVLMDLDQVIQLGKANPTEPTLPTRDDLCTIGFTSGTTGVIKGVMLQHKACISSARGVALMTDFQESTYLSYLTYAHMYDRDIIYFLMHRMVRIGFFSGEKTLLLEDMQTLQPTFVAAIPPVLNRIYDKLALNTIGAKGLKGMLCRMAHRSKVKRITSGRGYRHPLWDRIVFDKVAKLLGGRVQLLASGGCMLGPEVQNFMRACLSCNVAQGYGLTETTVTSLAQAKDDYSTGNCGTPCPGLDVRLRSIPEMGYSVADHPCPRGELLMRSDSVTAGYYKQPELTAEMMEDGWILSGDIAQINADGSISILERIKNVIRSASATYLEPERLELVYSNHKLVDQCYVYSSMHFCKVIVIVVPKSETFIPWARGIAKSPTAGLEELCRNKDVAEAMTKVLTKVGADAELIPDAMIGAAHLEPTPFAQINSEFITSTLKIRRHLVNRHYMPVFDKFRESSDFSMGPQFKMTEKI